MKRFKVTINGITRENELLDEKEISKRLRRKWIQQAVDNTDTLNILICSSAYIPTFDPENSGWSINHSEEFPIISVRDSVGKEQIFDINKMVKSEFMDLLETWIEQAKLMYLTNNDYECAWSHLLNKLKHERNKASCLNSNSEKRSK